MSNQDNLHKWWWKEGPKKNDDMTVSEIIEKLEKVKTNSSVIEYENGSGAITPSGWNYAISSFFIEKCTFTPNIENELKVIRDRRVKIPNEYLDKIAKVIDLPNEETPPSMIIKKTETQFDQKRSKLNVSKNIILYGPPGTGKTYNTVAAALNILDVDHNESTGYSDKRIRFDSLKSAGRIQFVTFHQSFSYEDFVEGISAETKNGALSYSIKDGIFKKIAIEALYSKFEDENNQQTQLTNLWNAIPENKREAAGIPENKEFDKNNYSHKTLILTNHKVSDFKPSTGKPYVLIIDEINRGNTSRVFGELITLIETTKRAGSDEAMDAILPYSQETFTVPDNLYIIGTMNTADRSLALMDTALRRRFDFIEMMPDPTKVDFKVDGIDIKDMLETINNRIEALYDREHTIGHAFFMTLKDDSTIEKLAYIFKNNILPLLEEYFFEDWDKIIKILGDSKIYTLKKSGNLGFTHTGKNYLRDYEALKTPKTYINIYKSIPINPA